MFMYTYRTHDQVWFDHVHVLARSTIYMNINTGQDQVDYEKRLSEKPNDTFNLL